MLLFGEEISVEEFQDFEDYTSAQEADVVKAAQMAFASDMLLQIVEVE